MKEQSVSDKIIGTPRCTEENKTSETNGHDRAKCFQSDLIRQYCQPYNDIPLYNEIINREMISLSALQ